MMPESGKTRERAGALECAARTDTGLIRSRNEDFLCLDAERGWLLLADGMGGHSSGDLASALAVNYVLHALRDTEGVFRHISETSGGMRGILAPLVECVIDANTAIRSAGRLSGDANAMGSTFVGVLLGYGEMAYVYVGDSRLYMLREGVLRQLSRDHTLVQEFVDAGRLTAEMAQNHPYRGLLTRGLGVHDEVEPEIGICALRPGDRLLLCTDGLTDMVEEGEIARMLGMPARADEIARSLVDAANAAGGRDNVSVIVAWLLAGTGTHSNEKQYAPAAYLQTNGCE